MPPEEKMLTIKTTIEGKKARTVMIVAGEASGDMHGASLVREMLKIDPSLIFYGMGGNKMQEAGVKLIVNAAQTAVVGLTEVISKLGTLFRTIRQLRKSLDEMKPELVILIDYPDFNLNFVAPAAKKRKIKVFYYISPQVWAWRKSRIHKIKRLVSKMAVILPFEVDTYAAKGFKVDYVGHPLLDLVKPAYAKQESKKIFNLDESKTTIGLLPGSRHSEVVKLLPEMLRAAEILSHKIKTVQFVLPLADTLEKKTGDDIVSGFAVKVMVISDKTYDVVSCCDLAIVASGTATLETALLSVPMVIIYKIAPLSYFIGKLIVDVQNIGLANIIAGKTVVPELIQEDANGNRIADEAMAILNNEERKQKIINELAAIRGKLGNPGAARKTARLAYDLL
jgi:lipid-A-disaccharide synthase